MSRSRPHFSVTLLVALVLLTWRGEPLLAREPARWIELRGPHFVVVSNAGEDRARYVSQQLEHVRTMLQRALAAGSVELRQPVVVLAVDSERSLRELLPQFWERKGVRPVGAYWRGPHRHYIVLRVDTSEHEQYRRVLHEYVHLLTHANVPDLPVWLDEGLSEFWGAAVVRDDVVEIGHPPAQDLKVLRGRQPWIPIDELLAAERIPDARDKKRLSLFYGQSWALADYAMLGGPSTNLELAPSKYVEALSQSGNPVEAGTLAFGNLAQLEQALAAYVRAARFRALRIEAPRMTVQSTDGDDGVGARVRTLSSAESLTLRAGFLVDGERPAAALPLLKEAVRENPDEPSVLEMLGYFHFQQNNPREAAGWFDRAIASGSASHLAYFYRAILAGTGLEGSRPEEDYLRRAIDIDPGFAPAYARLASLDIRQDRLDDALPLMRRATELEPENTIYWVDLGRVLARLGRPDEARKAGERGLATARSASSRGLVEAFLLELEQASIGRENLLDMYMRCGIIHPSEYCLSRAVVEGGWTCGNY